MVWVVSGHRLGVQPSDESVHVPHRVLLFLMGPSLSAVEDVIPGLPKIPDRSYEAYQAKEVRDALPKTRTEAGDAPPPMDL